MSPKPGWIEGIALIFGAAALALVIAGPSGLWVIDEFIYLAQTEAATRGALTLANPIAGSASEGLSLHRLLTVTGGGLAPQYPSGYALLAAPFVALWGVKGMMALNAVAAAGCVWLTGRLAFLLFNDRGMARTAAALVAIGSYLIVYAVAVLPHALSALFVLAVACFTARAALEPRSAIRDALLAGLLFGAAVAIRVDAVLIAPPLGIAVLAYAPRPWRLVPPAALGALPGLAAASWFNLEKFGVLSPVSYGKTGTGGDTDLVVYAPLIAVSAIALILALTMRAPQHRAQALPLVAIAIVVAAALATLVSPQALGAALDYLHGAYVLFFDIRALDEVRMGIVAAPDGSVSFWGLTKKAFFQSLPWVGAAAALLVARPPGKGFGVALCLLAILFWALPYMRTGWHGGYAVNMRYFTPLLPFAAILAAAGLRVISSPVARRPWLGYGAGCALAIVYMALVVGTPGGRVALQNSHAQLLFAGMAALSVAAALRPRLFANAARAGFALAVTVGATLAYAVDLPQDRGRRAYFDLVEPALAVLPDHSLVYVQVVEPFMPHWRAGAAIATTQRETRRIDPALIDAAFADGRRVFAQGADPAGQAAAISPALEAVPFLDPPGWLSPIWEIRQRSAPDG